ncbi:FAD-dependent oxidoreductase [Streptomyces sp. NPDC058045]|uniref:FAD-dependent oxidoreductase n=1 Tax=Streptomyces sp. NPDC058045 TaxID=3346311 RepID=UPI0036EB816E
MDAEVIVVGGGVIGLTTAVELAERGRRVAVWTREPPGGTTSSVAGALWWPYRIEPEAKVGGWAVESLRVFEELAADPGATGVRLVPGVHAGARLSRLGRWAAEVRELRAATAAECPGGGLWARLPLVDMPVYLAWLEDRLRAAGGTVLRRTLDSLDEALAEAPTVVNCSGIGARWLVPDESVRPVRGQVVLVENPGVDTWYADADSAGAATTYFFPQPGRLLLGGTAEEDVYRPEPDERTAAEIVARCARVRPELADARILGHRVGLRPARPAVRLEREVRPDGRALVHHYGHGGAGVTVSWGCAREATRLVVEAV